MLRDRRAGKHAAIRSCPGVVPSEPVSLPEAGRRAWSAVLSAPARQPGVAFVLPWAALALAPPVREAIQKLPAAAAAFAGPFNLTRGLLAHWVEAAVALGWVALFWAAAAGAGAHAIRWLTGRPPARGSLLHPTSVLAGLAVYATIILAKGLCGLFFPVMAVALLCALVAAGARTFGAAGGRRERPAGGPISAWKPLALLAAGLPALFALTPETWSDSLAYHLAAPADFNDVAKWYDVAQNTYRFPLLAEAVFGQALLLGGERAAALANLAGVVLLALLLWRAARDLAGPAAGWLSLCALFASDQIGFHMGNTNQGFYSAAFSFAAVWIWNGALAEGRSPARLFLAGIFAGWALCAKYTAAAPLAGMLAWHLAGCWRRPRSALANMLTVGGGALLSSAPFLFNGWVFTGNPVFPLFFGGFDWTEESGRLLHLYGCPGRDILSYDPRSAGTFLLRLFAEQQPLLALAVPAIAFVSWRRLGPFLVAWGVAVALWMWCAPCLRLMLPAFPAFALVTAVSVVTWMRAGALVRTVLSAAALAAVLAGIIVAVAAVDFHRKSFMAAVGLEPGEDYLNRVTTSYREAVVVTGEILPPGLRMIVLGDIRGYGFRQIAVNRDIVDPPLMLQLARAARSPEEIGKRMRQIGSRYVLLNYVGSEYQGGWLSLVYRWRPAELNRLWEFWRRHGVVVWRGRRSDGVNGGFILYRIERKPFPPPRTIPFLPGAEMAAAKLPGENDGEWLDRMLDQARAAPGVAYFDARIAVRLLAAGKPREAHRFASRALGCGYPEEGVVHALRGAALMKAGDYTEAEREFAEAEKLIPSEPSFPRFRQACLDAMRDFEPRGF